ncbi:MAG: hypothetical protein QXG12_05980 [Thermoproteota archaeon]
MNRDCPRCANGSPTNSLVVKGPEIRSSLKLFGFPFCGVTMRLVNVIS